MNFGNKLRTELAINNKGAISGWGIPWMCRWPQLSIWMNKDEVYQLGVVGSGESINDENQILFVDSENDYIGVWDNGQFVYIIDTLDPLDKSGFEGETLRAGAINNQGEAVGRGTDWIYGPSAFLWKNGNLYHLNDLVTDNIDYRLVTAESIHDQGQIIGKTDLNPTQYYLFKNGSVTLMEGFVPIVISNKSQIVGGNFLYSKGITYDLNTLINDRSDWNISGKRDINDRGQIVGYGEVNDESYVILLNPSVEALFSLNLIEGMAPLTVGFTEESNGAIDSLDEDASATITLMGIDIGTINEFSRDKTGNDNSFYASGSDFNFPNPRSESAEGDYSAYFESANSEYLRLDDVIASSGMPWKSGELNLSSIIWLKFRATSLDSAGILFSKFDVGSNRKTISVITGQLPLDTESGMALKITLSDLVVDDIDNTFPGDFSLKVQSGDNYARSGNTIIPDNDFTGILIAPVCVNDGIDNSNIYNLNVTVNIFSSCPDDPDKIAPGICGCGVPDADIDEDGVYDCIDDCNSELDSDGDGLRDCDENCPRPESDQTIDAGESVNFQCDVLSGNPLMS